MALLPLLVCFSPLSRTIWQWYLSVIKPWTKGSVAILGDSVHIRMSNLGQGGCEAIKFVYVLAQELCTVGLRDENKDMLGKC